MTLHDPLKVNASQYRLIAEVIGELPARKLCAALGGTRVYVPMRVPRNHEIAAAIGAEAAQRLADHFHGTQLAIPKAHLRRQRAIELLAEVDAGRMTMSEVALSTDYTVAHLYDLRAGLRDDRDQLALPF